MRSTVMPIYAALLFYLPIVACAEMVPTMSEATAAFDAGKVDDAEAMYLKLLDQHGDTASLLYNLGNCAYLKGRMGRAVVYYERARRLAPRDSDIVENLNFVRGQLNRPAIGTSESPMALIANLRDKLRPDEWLLAAAAAWCLMWAGAGYFRIRRVRVHPSLATLAVLCIMALAAASTQHRSTYSLGQAVVIEDDAPLYDLPNNRDIPAKLTLKEGEYVRIEERRTDWSRVRVDEAEGWLPNSTLGTVW